MIKALGVTQEMSSSVSEERRNSNAMAETSLEEVFHEMRTVGITLVTGQVGTSK